MPLNVKLVLPEEYTTVSLTQRVTTTHGVYLGHPEVMLKMLLVHVLDRNRSRNFALLCYKRVLSL